MIATAAFYLSAVSAAGQAIGSHVARRWPAVFTTLWLYPLLAVTGAVAWAIDHFCVEEGPRSPEPAPAETSKGAAEPHLLKDLAPLLLLGLVQIVSIVIGTRHPAVRFWSGGSVTWALVGVFMIWAALALRFASTGRLGRFFNRRLHVEQRQPVIDSGPYAVIRHPGYLTAIIGTLGGIVMTTYWPVLVAAIPVLGYQFRKRIYQEEAINAERMDGYPAYMTRVRWRLVPGVW